MDISFRNLAIAMASVVAIVLFSILVVVFQGSLDSMARYGWQFLVTSDWNPVDDQYGAGAAIYGTLITSLLALMIAVPLGVGTAIFITENIIPKRIRDVIGLMVELLAAIPSVVLGLWAIFVMEPFIRPGLELLYQLFNWFPLFSTPPMGPGTIPAVLILVVMILPIITAISRDCLNQVPPQLRQAAVWGGHNPLGSNHQCDSPGSDFRNHWWCDVGLGPGHGRNHGRDHDHRKFQQLQRFAAGPWQHHRSDAGQSIW